MCPSSDSRGNAHAAVYNSGSMQFTDLLDQHGVDWISEGDRHCREGWVQMQCPFCGRGSRKYHLGYNIAERYVNCYQCGYHRLTETVMALTGLSFPDAKNALGGVGVRIESKPVPKKTGTLVIPKHVGPMQKPHRRYLRDVRGMDPDVIERVWQVQGIGIAPRLSWRLFIPIMLDGEVVSWTTRSIGSNAKVRYMSASEAQEAVPHKSLLYGEHFVESVICVVEGPLDAWKIGPGCVATCGTGYSRAQVRRISQYPIRALCFDNEPAAQQRARSLADDLSVFPGETMVVTLDSKDAGEASEKELRKLRKGIGL